MNEEPENTNENEEPVAPEVTEAPKKKKKKKKKKREMHVSSLLTHGKSTRAFLRTRGTHEGGREDGLDPNYEYRYIRKTPKTNVFAARQIGFGRFFEVNFGEFGLHCLKPIHLCFDRTDGIEILSKLLPIGVAEIPLQ